MYNGTLPPLFSHEIPVPPFPAAMLIMESRTLLSSPYFLTPKRLRMPRNRPPFPPPLFPPGGGKRQRRRYEIPGLPLSFPSPFLPRTDGNRCGPPPPLKPFPLRRNSLQDVAGGETIPPPPTALLRVLVNTSFFPLLFLTLTFPLIRPASWRSRNKLETGRDPFPSPSPPGTKRDNAKLPFLSSQVFFFQYQRGRA